jgi:hypothetical protein
MRSNQVHIDSPCHESWETMDGDAERRFCGVCQKHVHNLSAMRLDDARELLRESASGGLCVRYNAEADGTLRFRDLVPTARLTRNLIRSAFAAALLAACTPTVDGPIADLGDAVIESIRDATSPTSDGGCDYTTGPFTTFHLAPGHVLCRSTGHDADALPPAIIITPTPIAGPAVPIAEPEPIDPPMMGQAIAMPEPIEPFVPCDPKPAYVSPQPHFAPPPPPAFERMGDIAPPKERPPVQGGIGPSQPPPHNPGFAPPPPPHNPGFAPPPPPHNPGFAPPPPPRNPGFAPPPPPREPEDMPLMGSISPASAAPEKMGRVASPR